MYLHVILYLASCHVHASGDCDERQAAIVPTERCNASQDEAEMVNTCKRRMRRTVQGDRAKALRAHSVPAQLIITMCFCILVQYSILAQNGWKTTLQTS